MIPPTLSRSQILGLEGRVRQTYTGIEDLASGIESMGLLCPIILREEAGQFYLVDGGRRLTAMDTLNYDTFYHANCSVRGQPGFVVSGESDQSPLMKLMAEISANHDREDIPWFEELPAIVQAYKLVQAEHHSRGEEIAMRAFGGMLGVAYQDLRAAVSIWDAYQENPAKFQEYSSVRQAAARCLRDAADAAAKMHLTLSSEAIVMPEVKVQVGPQLKPEARVFHEISRPEPENPELKTVPISRMFRCCNSLDYMENSLPKGFVNHIFTDPDYALSVETLSANSNNMADGVAQASVEDSLSDLRRFLVAAFNVVDDYGFCVTFIDQEHWQTLRDFSIKVGWRCQRWMNVWRKSDYRSNKSPQHNFTKNYETAMILRKPNACLHETQTSSVFDWPMGKAVQQFNHPFAKPTQVWRWLMQGITRPGDKFYDPFMGSGSSIVAGVEHGLAPMGSELVDTHFANAQINIRVGYEKKLGKVNFQ